MSFGSCSGSFTESNGMAGTDWASAAPLPATSNAATSCFIFASLCLVEFEDVEAGIAVDDVDEPTLVDIHIIGLRRGLAGRGLGDEPAGFLRRHRIGDIYDAQTAREPRAVDERAIHALLELVCTEACRCGAAPRRVELAHFEDGEGLHR